MRPRMKPGVKEIVIIRHGGQHRDDQIHIGDDSPHGVKNVHRDHLLPRSRDSQIAQLALDK
jgi:hypothetical protein